MKIYYIANARMPTERAHGIQLAKMCEALLEAGVDVELVLPDRATHKKPTREFYGLRRDIPMRKIWALDTYHLGGIGFYIGSFSFMVSYARFVFIKKLQGQKFILYTIDMDQFSFVFFPLLHLLLGIPYFIEIHDSKKRSLLYMLLFKYARGIITINELIKNELMTNFGITDKNKILVFPNGIDVAFFDIGLSRQDARQKLGLPPNAKIILYGGQFYQWKGFEIFSEVAERIGNKVIIAIVGADQHEVQQSLGIENTPPNLMFFGKKPYIEMPIWFSAADALLVLGTKKNEYSYLHTSPMKLFEYMASKRPVIAANTPAIHQIADEPHVFFYTPDDASDMARAIARALENSAEVEAKIENAFIKAAAFSWEKRGKMVFDFLTSKTG